MSQRSEAPSSNAPPERITQLDGLRFFAFFFVFLNHLITQLPMLWMGVDIFFVISGFLITGNLVDLRQQAAGSRDFFSTFYWRRFLRIFPPYYLVLFVMMAFRPSSRPDLPFYLVFLSNIRDAIMAGGDGPLGVFWSLAVEEQFYLLWPLVVWHVPRRHLSLTCVGFIVFAFTCRLGVTLAGAPMDAIYRLMPCRFDLLASGALLALSHRKRPLASLGPRPWFALGAISVAAFLVLAISFRSFRAGANSLLFNLFGYSLIVGFCVSLVALTIEGSFGPLRHVFDWSPLRYVGKISYVCYLVHDFVRWLLEIHAPEVTGPLRVLVTFACTVAIASASFYAIELPLTTRLRYVIRPRRSPTPPPSNASA